MTNKATSIYDLIDRVNISEVEKATVKEQVRKIELIGDFIGFINASIWCGMRALRLKLQPGKAPVASKG